jgi:hypothetical protein
MSGEIIAAAPYYICGARFYFNPDTVPRVPIDPANGLTPDLGGDPARAVRRPICPDCIPAINAARAARGLGGWPVPPNGAS